VRKTLGFQTPASKLQQVLRRPSEPAAVIGKKKSWYGTFPVTRLIRQVKLLPSSPSSDRNRR